MANRTPNNFSSINEEQILKSIQEIRVNAMDPFILPIFVMLDLSGSMHSICDKALYVLECLKEQFSDIKCPCDAFLILSVIYNCRQKNDMPNIVYSGFIQDFDFDDFKKKVTDCYGLTPLINALKQVNKYGKILVSNLDNRGILHSCPVNVFITDYIENVSNDDECYSVINNIQDEIEAEQCLAIEFILTESQALEMNVKEQVEKSISFGGFRCKFNGKEIKKIIDSLMLSSSTIDSDGLCAPPRCDIKEYNEHLRKTLITKMHEYWDKQDD